MQDSVFWNFGGPVQVSVTGIQLPQALFTRCPENRQVLRVQFLHPLCFPALLPLLPAEL